ncbi:sugar ABC transporter permease [Cohnella sp. CIP 111063]|uniref:carbohydrate ABC transporter permease n=1 Tax=unclassified Cohnella TaxID=2636738 RepID=UPI000B8BD0B8|nr:MULTISPECIES: carbohydrate ABC transporter permease [unclassified Cohnella]OXS53878.1 sugar ABC transporter permease [Cohnella sp. CIP 111063]PRX62463.1 multiple sugar transport system permease protein [Cohnella sp. SGD-V74]
MNSVRQVNWTSKIGAHAVLVLFSIFFMVPFFILVSTSFKTQPETFVYPIKWFPENLHYENYLDVFNVIPFFRYFFNTSFITIMNVIGVLFSCPLAAYALARLQWKGRELVFYITLAVMMIPYAVTMVPVYMIFAKLQMIGTYWPLILPAFFGAPFFIFLLRQFFKGLPKELEDAARVDGCNEMKIYLRIFLPLTKPALLTIIIFQVINSWNDFMGPLLYLQESGMYTLQIGLQQFKTSHATDWPALMAASVLISLPIIVLFFFAQKRFMEGITFTGIKG